MIVFASRKELIRALYQKKRFGRMLYVGSALRMPTDYLKIKKMARRIDCLEIWPPTVEVLKARKLYHSVICGDIADYEISEWYDIVVWWHGPEHMEMDRARKTIIRLRETAPIVWLATPWGDDPQGGIFDNPFNAHKSAWRPKEFEECGYRTAVCGIENGHGSQCVAWYPPEQVDETQFS